ncbi:xanthine dehydrogenase family protein molybdopterin-binding subunit [Pseudaminobacter arsenicus]|uniref:Xanthine dehydrogenase family protein molybdopterin-binding subunit n=1 Tax=Borborobacter arsenicus TaxID=1851146 RepID=A0A432V361_9HYPH|nr:xanthine dehydrogenase family protein molybdopterin-binding subunit [Pseudaminobacter arsenicus]RUM96644.1 xanthine dehydrogenase family protein molybdopterin-binding subunit [Pseudaminobacter arsenicus]
MNDAAFQPGPSTPVPLSEDDVLVSSRPKYVGKPVQRLEDPRLLTGAGRYVADMVINRMVHVAFLRSDQSHARILAIRTEAARAATGVIGVYTAADFSDIPPVVATSRMRNYHATSNPALAVDKVRYVGEPVAVVVAKSRYLAEDALALIEVDYEPLDAVIEPEAAAASTTALLHDQFGTNVIFERVFQTGEASQVLAAAPLSVKGRFRFHRKSPLFMENRSYLAEYDRGRDLLTLHSSTQIPGIVRDVLSSLLAMPGKVRVVAPDVGGGFGGKGSLYQEEIIVSALARKLGRPVKFVSDRMEDLASSSQGFDELVEAELGFDETGRFLALKADVLGDIGAYSIYPWTAALEPVQVVSFLPGAYKIPNYFGRVRGVATSKAPTGPYRGVGRPTSVFVLERLVDMAAHKLGMDPKDLRHRNLVGADEFPYRIGSGIIWERSGFVECLDRACEVIDYEALRQRQQAARKQGRWLGIGIATYAELTGIGSRISVAPGMPINTGNESATVRIDSTGAVTAIFGVASHGQSLETTLAQIVAEELGVRPQDVEIVHGDSAATAHGTGTYASRSAVIGGGAAILTTRALREKVKRVASHLLEASVEDIETGDGRIFVRGTDHQITFAELARAVYSDMQTLPLDKREKLEASESFDPYLGTTTTATHIALVEIDPETYGVKLQRFVVAEDCGRMINPLVVDGQVHGGVAQGIGAALLEELVFDGQGQLLTASLVDYMVPTAVEVPAIEVSHLESVLPNNPGGFRGMGEGGTIGAPAAVANAIADALAPLGIEIFELPATPERLFRLISAAGAIPGKAGAGFPSGIAQETNAMEE